MALINKLTAIADAIRSKTGGTEPLTLDGMADAINGISAGGGFPNGTEWTQSNVTSGTINVVRNAGGKWVAGGTKGVYCSTDGKVWTESNIMNQECTALYYGRNTWVAISNDKVYSSPNGLEWQLLGDAPIGGCDVLYYANGMWFTTNFSALYASTDCITWTYIRVQVRDIIYANGLWVGCGDGIHYSEDGYTWLEAFDTGNRGGHKVIYENDLFVVACEHAMCYSEDGKNWTSVTISTAIQNAKDVQYGNGVWVAAYYGLFFSLDGKNWTRVNIPDDIYYGLHYSNGVWAVCGQASYYSLNGKDWSLCDTPNADWRYAVSANGIRVGGSWVMSQGLTYSVTWEA